MNSWKTKNGFSIFQVLDGRTNAYLITSIYGNLIVDTGKETQYKKLKSNINKILESEENLNYLILTHTHYDHCQSAKQLFETYQCEIIVHQSAILSIEKGYTEIPMGTMTATKIVAHIGKKIGKWKFRYAPFNTALSFNKTLQVNGFGDKIIIIHTPGHSSDSISIIIDDEIAIVGDAMFGIFKNSIFPPYADNIPELIESWKKLHDTTCSLFLPGHGKAIKRSLLKKSILQRTTI